MGLLAGSIAISVLIVEIVLRIVLPTPIVWKYPQEQYIYDPEIGFWLRPNQHAFTHDKPVIINSVGIRDSEYPPRAPSGVYRILALGDSQTFGNGLKLEDTWPKQLESELNQSNLNLRFEVVNSGLPGSDTWQHEIMLERMIKNYHPDSVVLAFYVNDVVKRHIPKPSWHKSNNEKRIRIIYALKQSALLLSLRQAYYTIRQAVAPTAAFLGQQALLSGKDNENIQSRWRQVDKSISSMKGMADRYNIRFMIASLPRRDQVDGRLSWHAYNKHLQRITERYGVPMLSMLEPLQRGYKKYGKKLFIPWDGHNSEIANHIIAQQISKTMLIALGLEKKTE